MLNVPAQNDGRIISLMQSQMIRAFIAIVLPQEVTAVLAQLSHTFAKQIPDRAVRWVTLDKMHLTLRFLGETAVTQLPTIATELDRVTATCAPFNLYLNELGCFPNRKRPRVIWASLAGDTQLLQDLKRAIDIFLSPMGWEQEKRPFQAHLTLGRVNDARKLHKVNWDVPVQKVEWQVTAVYLIESQLRPQGPVYTTRHTSSLKHKT